MYLNFITKYCCFNEKKDVASINFNVIATEVSCRNIENVNFFLYLQCEENVYLMYISEKIKILLFQCAVISSVQVNVFNQFSRVQWNRINFLVEYSKCFIFWVAPAPGEWLVFLLWCPFVCLFFYGQIILYKKLTPDGSVLASKDTFSVLMILCLGLKDTLQEVLIDTFAFN